jgi:ElaB/YqjD/DUF883 family membrane-anchored ribosome-binding protein
MEKFMTKLFEGVTTTQLIHDLNVVLEDAEALLEATANQTGDKIVKIRNKAGDSIRAVKATIEEAENALQVKSKAAAKATDVYVHENPWQSVGLAAAVGFLIGWLTRRH